MRNAVTDVQKCWVYWLYESPVKYAQIFYVCCPGAFVCFVMCKFDYGSADVLRHTHSLSGRELLFGVSIYRCIGLVIKTEHNTQCTSFLLEWSC